ncbi:heparinase II/III domain-containing protein [Nitratireductor alexandrii]|uniref:heparinase II/III domain-containing protein n=1 Tax=Nitratireductor alexandrii TaxID=2448161 RepID=UPI0013DEE93F|nr:heparinase II/III family protein [Nitratireductor alexandrii]
MHKLKPYAYFPAYVLARSGARPGRLNDGALASMGAALRAELSRRIDPDAALKERMRKRATSALNRKWGVLGFGELDIPTGEGWWRDGFHGHQWPLSYFPQVDFVASEIRSDVKVPWELSRFQYTLWLAEGALLDPEDSDPYVRLFETLVDDWTEANPPGWGVNWTVAMEVAIRAVNLLVAGAVIYDRLDEAFRGRFIRLLDDHYRFILRFPETSDVNGNHYLANLMGTAVLSSVLAPGAEFLQRVEDFALEADRQFEVDGSHLERAPVYHRLCLDMVAIVAAVQIATVGTLSPRLRDVFARAVRFAEFVSGMDWILPIFGDCDGGKVLEFGTSPRDFSALASLGGQDGVPSQDDLLIWLQAIAGRETFLDEADDVPLVGEKSGFLRLGLGGATAVMRVGAQGLKGRASHDHDDALSIWLRYRERDIVVDRGCHSYTLDPALRESFIFSGAHNLVQPRGGRRYDGRPGSIYLSMRGAPYCYDTGLEEDGKCPSFNGAIREVGEIREIRRQVRAVTLGQGVEIEVCDTWSSDIETELNWHFGPGIIPKSEDRGVIRFCGDTALQSLMVDSAEFETEMFEFEFHPNYGRTEKCRGVRFLVPASQDCRLVSRFRLGFGEIGSSE